MEIFSNPLFATYSVYARNASIMGSQKLDCLTNKSICTSGCVCTAQTIHSQLLASVTLLPSLQFRLITSLHLPRSVTPLDFKSKSFTSSSTTSFHLFLGLPQCLAPSTFRVTHFFVQSSPSFHETHPYHHNLCTILTMSSVLFCFMAVNNGSRISDERRYNLTDYRWKKLIHHA